MYLSKTKCETKCPKIKHFSVSYKVFRLKIFILVITGKGYQLANKMRYCFPK